MGQIFKEKPNYTITIIFVVIVISMIVALIALDTATRNWDTAEDVIAVLGVITTFLGTAIGSISGFKIGSEGKDNALQRTSDVETSNIELKSGIRSIRTVTEIKYKKFEKNRKQLNRKQASEEEKDAKEILDHIDKLLKDTE